MVDVVRRLILTLLVLAAGCVTMPPLEADIARAGPTAAFPNPWPAHTAVTVAPAPSPDVLAVMPMQGNTDDASLLNDLTNHLRVTLASRGTRVVGRGAQEEALSAIVTELQAESYDACHDERCQIPLGKALAASHILRPSLRRFGDRCVLSTEVIGLATEVTEHAATLTGACHPAALLDLSDRLAKSIIKPPIEASKRRTVAER